MVPWLWFWAPQLHFPWSGAVSQNIEPRTDWFARLVPEDAGDAEIEAEATRIASYGRQLGLLTELLLGLAGQARALPPEAARARDQLQALSREIEALKTSRRGRSADRLLRELQALQRRDGAAFGQLAAQLRPLLDAATPARRRGSGSAVESGGRSSS